MKLSISSINQTKREGFKLIDSVAGKDIDFVFDLEKFPWTQIKDNSVEEVYIYHYAEYAKDLVKFMEEVYRICEDEAKVTIVAPYYTSLAAWQDPTVVRPISEATWACFQKTWREVHKSSRHAMKCDFEVTNMIVYFNEPWNQKSEEARRFAQSHYWNAVSEILTELKVKKA